MISRSVRADTLPVFHGKQTLIFTLFDRAKDESSILRWLQVIGKVNAELLSSLKIIYRAEGMQQCIEKDLLPEIMLLGVGVNVVEWKRLHSRCHCVLCVMSTARGRMTQDGSQKGKRHLRDARRARR